MCSAKPYQCFQAPNGKTSRKGTETTLAARLVLMQEGIIYPPNTFENTENCHTQFTKIFSV